MSTREELVKKVESVRWIAYIATTNYATAMSALKVYDDKLAREAALDAARDVTWDAAGDALNAHDKEKINEVC